MNLGLLLSLPVFAVSVWGDVIFALVYGGNYDRAGHFAMALAPGMWLALQTGWPERIFEASNRQDLSFRVQIGSDLVVLICTMAALVVTHDALATVITYACVYLAYNVLYLFFVFKAGRLPQRRLALILARSLGLSLTVSALFVAIRHQL